MAKLTDIKYRIDQLDGGTFQTLCDVYLKCRGYGTGYSLGMKIGTSKTTKGNPDTYFLTTNNKYVFVMYTTQKSEFVKKALEDLQKCFDSSKTGISSDDIVEIVYCHTYTRLLAGEDKQLRDFCETRNSKLTLIGLDELGEDLYLKYPRLAKDYLGISIDTGQIITPEEFVQRHDENEMSAPLNTKFLFREDVVKNAKASLERSNILVISGPAGTGKTRLALQICKELSVMNKYEILCIKSNGLELYEDLVTSLEEGKEYLVLVDDANELSGLHHVLHYLSKTPTRPHAIKKIILTVRDYARQQVVTQVLEVEKPEILKIGPLKDENIKKLVQEAFGIANSRYFDRIVAIAEGNPRLAMLAAKLAAKAGSLDSIRDASELYDHYYGKQIESVSQSKTGTISMGIMAFFQVLHLDHLDRLSSIFDAAGITRDQFIFDLRQFHDMELVDLCHDKAAKISDQSFSNYLVKYVFIDQKSIPFNQMIEICFSINKERTISACNILLNVFSDVQVHEYIEQQIILVWDELQSDSERFPPFFRAFHMVRPTDTLLLLKDAIEQTPFQPFDLRSIVFKKNESEKSISDDIISILCSFKNHSMLPEAIELLLLYYRKRPDLFEQIYSGFVSVFGVDKSIYDYGYFTPKTAVEQLCAEIQANPSQESLLLFVRVAEQFLKLSFSRTEGGRRNTFTLYTIPLVFHEDVLVYRNMLLDHLFKIYEGGHCHEEIESFLIDYCSERGENIDYEIVRQEFRGILSFFTLLSTDLLYHCIIAKHIKDVAQRIEYDCQKILAPFADSPKYKIYTALCVHHEDNFHLSFEEANNKHKQRVKGLVQNYSLAQFQYLLQICTECILTVDQDERRLSSGMRLVMETLAENHELFADVVKAYMEADTPYSVRADDILINLFAIMLPEEVKKLISACDFSEKNSWLWTFYIELPEAHISIKWAEELLVYLQSPPKGLNTAPYRTLDQLKKYECVDKDILLRASKVISAHYEDSPFIFSLYFFYMMNSYSIDKVKVIEQYKRDIPLLEDIYLKNIMYSSQGDSDGELLSEIIKEDPEFLEHYLERAVSQKEYFYGSRDSWFSRLLFIWQEECFLNHMDKITEYLLSLEKIDGLRFRYSSGIHWLLIHREGETENYTRQEKWIQHEIERYYSDEQRMYGLFSVISDHGTDRRRNALKKFLELNSDYTLFEMLPLEASSWGGWGSMIPYMQERIEYLTSVLPMLSGFKFLKHRQKVEKDIEIWKARIKEEEIDEIMKSFS